MQDFEYKAIEIVKEIITRWTSKLNEKLCTFGLVECNKNDTPDNYFSEIEVYIWQNNNVIDVLNVVLFLNGKQVIDLDELPNVIDAIIQDIFNKL